MTTPGYVAVCYGIGMKANKPTQYQGIGVALGAGVGAALGVGMDNLGVGLGVGIALGVAVGTLLSKQD